MRTLIALLGAFGLTQSAFATTLECQVTDSAYKSPGSTSIADATTTDPNIIGKVFYLKRETGEVVGSSLFSNEGGVVTILHNVNEIINIVEVMSIDDHSDLKFLSIHEFEKKLTFSYYIGFLNLMLIGRCTET